MLPQGVSQQLELAGSRRFEQAQRFADLCLSRLHDTQREARPCAARACCSRFRFLISR